MRTGPTSRQWSLWVFVDELGCQVGTVWQMHVLQRSERVSVTILTV